MLTRRALCIATGSALLGGCNKSGTGARPPVPSEPAPVEFQLSHTVELWENEKWRAVKENFSFRGGDRFRIRLRASAPLELYLFNRAPGAAEYDVLYRNQIKGGIDTLLPGGEDKFAIDKGKKGDELIVLVASPKPLESFSGSSASPVAGAKMDSLLAALERDFSPKSSRRFMDAERTRHIFAGPPNRTALVTRLPLLHE